MACLNGAFSWNLLTVMVLTPSLGGGHDHHSSLQLIENSRGIPQTRRGETSFTKFMPRTIHGHTHIIMGNSVHVQVNQQNQSVSVT